MIFSRHSRGAAAPSLVMNVAATAPVNLPRGRMPTISLRIVAAENGAATHRTDTISGLDRRSWATRQQLANAIFEWIEAWYSPPAVIRLWATTALLPAKGCTTRRLLRQHDHHSQPIRETGGSSNLVLPALLRQSVARASDQRQRPDLQLPIHQPASQRSSREYPASKPIERRLWCMTASYSELSRRSPARCRWMTRTIRIARITCHGTGGSGGRGGGRSRASAGAGRAFHRRHGRDSRSRVRPSANRRRAPMREQSGCTWLA